jgi:hypothetical protein
MRKVWRITGAYNSNLLQELPGASSDRIRELQEVIVDSNGFPGDEHLMKLRFLGNLLRENHLEFTPSIQIDYPSTVNFPKDLDYLQMGEMADRLRVGKEKILSLAGARPLHISLMLGQKAGEFLTFTLMGKDLEVLAPYCNQLSASNYNIKFQVFQRDILDFMLHTKEKYQIIDLDLCKRLANTQERILEALDNCAAQRVVLGITHTMRGNPKRSAVYEARQDLVNRLQERFDILEGQHTYYGNTTLMFRETFVLERKVA